MPSYYSSFANASTRFSTQEIPVSLPLYPSLAQCSSMLLGTRMSGFLSLSLLHKCRSKLLAPGCQFLFCPSLFHKNAAACFLAQECQVLFLFSSFTNPAECFLQWYSRFYFSVFFKFASIHLAPGCQFFSFICSSKLFFPLSLLSKMQQRAFWHLEASISSHFPQ